MKKMLMHRTFKGMTLLEVLLVLAVTAIAIVLAVQYYSNVQLNAKMSQTIKQISNIAQGASQYLQTQQGKQLKTAEGSAIAQTLIDGAYISASDLVNPWARSNNLIVRLLFKPKLRVQISVPGMSQAGCNRLQSRLLEPYPNAIVTGCGGKAGAALIVIPLSQIQ